MKIKSEFLKKYVLVDSNGNQFGIQANKIIEERERDFVCILFTKENP